MEYSLYAIYYVMKSYLNLLLRLEVSEGATVGGIIIAVVLIGCALCGFGLARSYKEAQTIYNRKVEGTAERRYREASRAFDETRWSNGKKAFMNDYYRSRGWKR